MNIIDNTIIKRPTLKSIAIGTVFKWEDRVYMKLDTQRYIDYDFQVKSPVVNLATGTVAMVSNELAVQIVEAELHYK